jgi:murein DD-endopeptidase MepM/ murein hydrolase activator NlpD
MTLSRIVVRVLAMASAITFAGGGVHAAQAPAVPAPLAVSVHARSIQPGEVVRVSVTSTRPLTSLVGRFAERQVPFWPGPATDWEGLVGIDVETVPGEWRLALTGTAADQTTVTGEQVLTVAPKIFRERQLKVDPRFSDPPPSALPRIQREARTLEQIFDERSCRERPAVVFSAPSADPASSPFGSRSIFNGKPRSRHNGVDFASGRGAPIVAPADGRVVLVDDLYFTGTTVVLDHGCGIYSLFAHLDEAVVALDDRVRRGARLGDVGSTGRSTGPHLHWSVRLNGTRVDPLALIYISR